MVRARGLPWQSSDQDIARFFKGLNVERCVVVDTNGGWGEEVGGDEKGLDVKRGDGEEDGGGDVKEGVFEKEL